MSKIIGFFEGLYSSIALWINTTQWFLVAKITVSSLITLMLVFFSASMLFKEAGSFTVSFVPRDNEGSGKISLCETADFSSPSVNLNSQGIDKMTNISVNWLPEGLDSVDGSHNGEHYIAYTFYAKNSGDEACVLKEEFNIDSVVKDADDAIRVRIYKNGVPTTYAKISAQGTAEIGTTAFETDTVVYTETTDRFEIGQINKYTIVIWLEGDDPECLDNIKGGSVKMSMTFTVEKLPKS